MAPFDFTPVKIRGKRRGCAAEKWHTTKRRPSNLRKPRESQAHILEAASPAPSRIRKRRRKAKDETPLEALPAEILQQIFDHAGNIDLPTVSKPLALKLSDSQHLQNELTTRLLEPVLGITNGIAPATDRAAATRLLNSRFMTWEYFVEWLRGRSTVSTTLDTASYVSGEPNWAEAWSALQPSRDLLPPKKLLSPPFSEGKAQFLAILTQQVHDISALDPSYGEAAHDGLVAAILAKDTSLVAKFLEMGVQPSTDLVRVAVADGGCDEGIVLLLLGHSPGSDGQTAHKVRAQRKIGMDNVDLLDPILWTWAEMAREQGNERGKWLTEVLRHAIEV